MINKRFAISKNVSYVIPDDFRVPVECNSYEQAQNSFENCINKVRCECSNSANNCMCPEYSIGNLQNNSEAIMPLETPFAKLEMNSDEIVAVFNEEEVIVRVESKIWEESAELITQENCKVKATDVTGFYNCAHGAEVTIIC